LIHIAWELTDYRRSYHGHGFMSFFDMSENVYYLAHFVYGAERAGADTFAAGYAFIEIYRRGAFAVLEYGSDRAGIFARHGYFGYGVIRAALYAHLAVLALGIIYDGTSVDYAYSAEFTGAHARSGHATLAQIGNVYPVRRAPFAGLAEHSKRYFQRFHPFAGFSGIVPERFSLVVFLYQKTQAGYGSVFKYGPLLMYAASESDFRSFRSHIERNKARAAFEIFGKEGFHESYQYFFF